MTKVFGKEIEQSIVINEIPHTFTTNSYFIDVPNQILEFTSRLTKENQVLMDGTYRIAMIYKREFELLLKLSGFKQWKVFGGFEYQPICQVNKSGYIPIIS